MKKTVLIASMFAIGFAAPALAANYYVVQNTKTHKCSVAAKKPSQKSKTTVLLGAGTAYTSKQEAATAMAGMSECKAA